MSKIKVENSFIWVIANAIKMYSTNFLNLCGYMAFPVLGQIFGLILTVCLAGIYIMYLPELAIKYPIFNDNLTIISCVILITIPGMMIFIKAFWDYLVAYGAVNSVTECYLSTGKIYDFPSHNATVTTQAIRYIGLWFLYSIFMLLAINPFLWVIGGVLFIYFILLFQVFSFEKSQTPVGCFRRSFEIIRGNWFRTVLIMLIIGVFTHLLFVQGFSVFFDFTGLTKILSTLFEEYIIGAIPIDTINENIVMFYPSFDYITASKVSSFLVYLVVAFVVVGFTLPLRVITWALWYKALTGNNFAQADEHKGKKKYSRKLSQNIIDRATKKNRD